MLRRAGIKPAPTHDPKGTPAVTFQNGSFEAMRFSEGKNASERLEYIIQLSRDSFGIDREEGRARSFDCRQATAAYPRGRSLRRLHRAQLFTRSGRNLHLDRCKKHQH